MGKVYHRVLFTVNSGCNPWSMTEIESDRINESSLEEWSKDCVLYHTGHLLTTKDWETFKANHRLIRKDGNLTYIFEFSRYTMEG